MLFMIIERFGGRAGDVYRRFRERGRMAPDGVRYVASWVDVNFERCFQVMEADTEALLQQWIANWNDLVEFEIVPVRTSEEAAAMMARPNAEEPQRVWVASGELEAQQIRSFLEAAGIATIERAESLRNTHGLTVADLGAVEILVAQADVDQARTLLAEAERGAFRLPDDETAGG